MDRRQFLENLWEEHMRHEFATRNTEDTLATMVDDAYVNHIPVLTGGVGKEALREFYSKRFIPQMPPDTEVTPVSRTIGTDQLVDVSCDHFVDFPPGTAFVKQVGETGPLQFRPICFSAAVEFSILTLGTSNFVREYPRGFKLSNSFARKASTSLRVANVSTSLGSTIKVGSP